jgi:hypothetical protein
MYMSGCAVKNIILVSAYYKNVNFTLISYIYFCFSCTNV